MDLMHNCAIRIVDGVWEGIYRVLLDEPALNRTALVRLDPPGTTEGGISRGGRKRLPHPKNPRKKPRAPVLSTVLWLDRCELLSIERSGLAFNIELLSPNSPARTLSERGAAHHRNRIAAARPFLDLLQLKEGLLAPRGLAGLVEDAMKTSGLSRSAVYTVFSLLCRYGFSERSLALGYSRCGAPGQLRPCDPGGRKKAGRKTQKQRIARACGILSPDDQPGTSSAWRDLILAADRKIQSPKPPMSERITQIIDSAFVRRYRQEADGSLVAIDLQAGAYPNRRQIRRVLENGISRLQRLIDSTTLGHYNRSLRGFRGCARQGVAGPGHTWAIDSTVGDIYLRSSINRAWIIGRPIVYIMADVWSTAIVGFYVCLQGPSWDMAKLALFCAGADPALIGNLWGYQPVLTLNPAPSLPAILLCDRGEYLSKGAKQTGMQLLPSASYTPPYRPDLKGLVEVLHRIAKDRQFHFVPGAIDARRAELELRRFNPNEAVLTVREFVHLLHVIFTEYNLTALRDKQLDAHMRADGVQPSPAGLWHWGHSVGIGFRRAVSQTDLISELLPSATARMRRDGIYFAARRYESEVTNEAQWSAHARAFGGFDIPCNYFPGTVSQIWTPNPSEGGLIDLTLSDHSTASHELTMDEVADAEAFYRIDAAAREHTRNLQQLSALRRTKEIVKTATELTSEAIAGSCGPKPTMTDAREMERSMPDNDAPVTKQSTRPASTDDHDATYRNIMRQILEGMNGPEGQND